MEASWWRGDCYWEVRSPKYHYHSEGEQPKLACAKVASLNEPHDDRL